jgi:hypothetical protein
MGQCADFSVKSQITRGSWIENSISEDQFFLKNLISNLQQIRDTAEKYV